MTDRNIQTKDEIIDVGTLSEYTTPLNELATDRYVSQYNLTVSASEEWPDSLRWDVTETDGGTVGKATNNEGRLQSGTNGTGAAAVQTREYGHYPPGSEAIPGIAVRLNNQPTGDQNAKWGYYDADNGMGFGSKVFANGESTAGGSVSSAGVQPYVFVRKGGSDAIYPQEFWNEDTLDGSGDSDNPSGLDVRDFSEITICRIPHLYYGGSTIKFAVLPHDRSGETPETPLTVVHTVAAETEPPINTPHLPSQAEVSNNGTAANLDLRLTAAHYVTGDAEADARANGVRNILSVGTTDWVPVISWRKRTGWESVNVRPVKIAMQAGSDMAVQIVENSELTGASFDTAPWTDSSETAVEYDTSATSMTQNQGNRRWIGQVSGGQGNQPGPSVAEDIDFNLPADRTITLCALGDSSGEIKAVVMNGEEF